MVKITTDLLTIPELKGSDKFIQHVMLKDDENKIFPDKMSFLLLDLTT